MGNGEWEMGNGKWGMGNGRGRLGATFELIDMRRADVRRETVICGTGLGATFVLRLWALGRGLWALKVSACASERER